MHEGALAIEDSLARAMIAARFPELADAPLHRIGAVGTVNTIIRVGSDHVARFPLAPTSHTELAREAASMDEFATACPFPSPRSLGIGAGIPAYPSAWSVQTWITGETAHPDRDAASPDLARDIGGLILALRSAETRGRTFDGQGRGGELGDHDAWVTECLERSRHLFDVPRAAALWQVLRAVAQSGAAVMSHRDLTPFNLVVAETDERVRLAGVLDSGSFGPADPALDLVAAWHLFEQPGRAVVRAIAGADEPEWLRGAAWALQQALGLGWYYETSNRAMHALGVSTVRRLLEDEELGALIETLRRERPASVADELDQDRSQ